MFCGASLALAPERSPAAVAPGFGSRPLRDPMIGHTVAGRFKLEELIGQGGMGKVYRARHLALDRQVCLKMLKPTLLDDPTLVGRFEREAKAVSRLNHPNVIQVLDFGRNESDGALFIAMEYVHGKDLRVVLRDEWPVPEERLCAIMAQALAALGEAHANNVIHRDLKPENIMVEQRRDQSDFVKVLDFGIAKILDSDLPGLTRSDVVCGTPQYMAPEQATGTALDRRCDLYSVGVILYQMATGELPFDGKNSMEVLTRHVQELPTPPRQRAPQAPISEGMEALILRALQKDPNLRPQTAEEFRELVLAVGRAVPARPAQAAVAAATRRATHPSLSRVTAPILVPPAPRRSWLVAAAAGAAVAVSLAGVALWALRHGSASAAGDAPVKIDGAGPKPLPTYVPRPRDPARAQQLVDRAAASETTEGPAAVRALLLEAVELDPDNAEAHYRLGGLFLGSQPDRARVEFEAARKLDRRRYGDVVDTLLRGL